MSISGFVFWIAVYLVGTLVLGVGLLLLLVALVAYAMRAWEEAEHNDTAHQVQPWE